jgi:hypothetical protein
MDGRLLGGDSNLSAQSSATAVALGMAAFGLFALPALIARTGYKKQPWTNGRFAPEAAIPGCLFLNHLKRPGK